MGVNVPNFGPGTAPGLLRRWAQTVEGLGFDLLMISDHIAVTPDVAEMLEICLEYGDDVDQLFDLIDDQADRMDCYDGL